MYFIIKYLYYVIYVLHNKYLYVIYVFFNKVTQLNHVTYQTQISINIYISDEVAVNQRLLH